MEDRVYLRKLEVSDGINMYLGYQDKDLTYLTGTESDFSLEQIEGHILHCQGDDSRYDFAICLKASDEMIGELSVVDIEVENESAAFRISMLSLQLTGKGYGTEAIKLVVDFVFNKLNLNRLQLEVYSHNPKGIRAYEKAGFVYEGRRRQVLKIRNEFSDEIIMAILKEDYLK
ncbi:MAG: GNAT family protein [Vagococcus sp.]|uniref:GNAT family N-acetyltransferase n=1 Tax=Vagococcus sp. TaxID=1933889 RepID=UPI002FC7555E